MFPSSVADGLGMPMDSNCTKILSTHPVPGTPPLLPLILHKFLHYPHGPFSLLYSSSFSKPQDKLCSYTRSTHPHTPITPSHTHPFLCPGSYRGPCAPQHSGDTCPLHADILCPHDCLPSWPQRPSRVAPEVLCTSQPQHLHGYLEAPVKV